MENNNSNNNEVPRSDIFPQYAQSKNIPSQPLMGAKPVLNPIIHKKHHFLGSVIIFIICGLLFFVVGKYAGSLNSTAFIVGGIIISLVVTGLFSFIAFLIRKISSKFGVVSGILLWVLILGLIVVGGRSYLYKNTGHIYSTPGVVYVSDHKISLDECLNTTDELTKYACGIDFAIKEKNRSICLKVYGNTDRAYYCQELYDSEVGYVPPTISECQSMTTNEGNYYFKNNCFRGIALSTFDTSICQYLSEDSRSSCVVQVQNDKYAKDNLCGPLFKNNEYTGASSCLKYVNDQHDIKLCKLLTRAQGPIPDIIDECISIANKSSK